MDCYFSLGCYSLEENELVLQGLAVSETPEGLQDWKDQGLAMAAVVSGTGMVTVAVFPSLDEAAGVTQLADTRKSVVAEAEAHLVEYQEILVEGFLAAAQRLVASTAWVRLAKLLMEIPCTRP